MSHPFSHSELARYSRHLMLPQVGVEGQRKLKAAKVLLVGTGGLGSPIGLYLAAAGIGEIGLVDGDVVEISNLQRQVLHRSEDVGMPKAHSAARAIRCLNPHVAVQVHEGRFDAASALDIASGYDVIVDATDNFPTRYLSNHVAELLGKPCVHGSVFRFDGQASVFWPGKGPCYRCVFPVPPPPDMVPSCAEGGVLGVLPGIIGTIQAAETLKLILGCGTSLVGRLLTFDALAMQFRELRTRRDPGCPICSSEAGVRTLIDYAQFCGDPMGEAPLQVDCRELANLLQRQPITLVDVRTPEEHALGALPSAKLIPLRELEHRVDELDPGRPLVVYCQSGGRGAKAVRFLATKGFPGARNLAGGLVAWTRDVESRLVTD